MSDPQNGQTVATENAVLTLDDILPKWERQPGSEGKLSPVERQEKKDNAARRKIIQKLLDQQEADRQSIAELTTANEALSTEKESTARRVRIMTGELTALRRLERQFANIVGAATQIAAAARKCTRGVSVDNKGSDLVVSYRLEDGTSVVHLASEEENYQTVQIGSGETQIVLLLGRGTGFARQLRAALKGYFKPERSGPVVH